MSSTRLSTPKSVYAMTLSSPSPWTQITPSSGSISKGDVVEPVDVFAAFLCDALYGPDLRDLVDVHGQAARAGMA